MGIRQSGSLAGFFLRSSSARRIVNAGFTVGKSQIQIHPVLSGAGRYALSLVFVSGAAIIAYYINPRIGESTASLFFAAVILSSWTGGLGPGLVATFLAATLAGSFYRLNPVGSSGFGWDDWLQAGVFVIVAVLISSLTSLRRRAETALQKSFDELELRIDKRTSELSQSNVLLRESEERFRLMVEGVADYAIVMLDSKGNVISWNPGASRIFGYSHDQALGLNAAAFY
jgi:PAS domain-containing protein